MIIEETLTITEASRLMHLTPQALRIGLQEKIFGFGYAIPTGDNHFNYWIGKRKFFHETMLDEKELEKIRGEKK